MAVNEPPKETGTFAPKASDAPLVSLRGTGSFSCKLRTPIVAIALGDELS